MRSGVLRAASVTVGVAALLSACTSGGGNHSRPDANTQVSTSFAPPEGSIDRPRPVECVQGWISRPRQPVAPSSGTPATGTPTSGAPASHAPTSGPPASHAPSTSGTPSASSDKNDVTIGPLTWPGLRSLATGDQNTWGSQSGGGWFYKIGPRLQAGAEVTVTVGAEQRARAGLEYGEVSDNSPATSVVFRSCQKAATGFPGGFFVAGDGRACVPLDVRVGDQPAQRVLISFFKGDCSA
jgi:hypothetical protein